MKRNLVFSFYIFDGWEQNFANRVHLAYLEKYHDVFDFAVFIVVCDDVSNVELISGFEKKIVDIGFRNVEFRVRKNTVLREAEHFYKELVGHLGEFEGSVMWAHNKGVSNIYFERKWLFNWLSFMYIGTAGLISDCEKKMFENYYGGEKYFYGAPLIKGEGFGISNMYGGGFFAMNPQSILKSLAKSGKELPKLSNRSYAEEFPGSLFEFDRLGSYRDAYIFGNYADFYSYSDMDWEDAERIVFNGITEKIEEVKYDIWQKLNT